MALSSAIETTTRIRLGTGVLPGGPARPDPPGQTDRHPRPPLWPAAFTLGIGLRLEPGRGRGPQHQLRPASRPGPRAPPLHPRPCGRRARPSSTAHFVDLPPAWAWPKPAQAARADSHRRAGAGGCRAEAPWSTTPTGGCPSAAAGWGRPSPGCAGWPREPGVIRPNCPWSPSAPLRAKPSWTHYAALGVDEVVLRLRAGSGADMGA